MDGGVNMVNKSTPRALKDIYVIRIRDPFTFRVTDVANFIEKAFENSMVDDYENLLVKLQEMALSEHCAIFLGQEDLRWSGLCIIMKATLLKDPQVFHFYNDGSTRFRKELVKTSLEWIKEQGYTGFWTTNATDAPDSVFKRLFNKAGNADKVGTIFRFEV